MNKIVERNYAPPDLLSRVEEFVQRLALTGGAITPESIAPIDHFHVGGLASTSRIASWLAAPARPLILDAGSGLGGPARYVASVLSARVCGIDFSEDFVNVARYLTRLMHLEDRVTFVMGDVLNLPWSDSTFDGAISQHVSMNIVDRSKFYGEISRVLKPGASFVLHDIISTGPSPAYPLPWAADRSMSFLLTAEQTFERLEAAGFDIALSEVDGRSDVTTIPQPSGVPPLAAVLGASDTVERFRNLQLELANGTLSVLRARAVKLG